MKLDTSDALFAGFAPATDSEWRRAAEESLNGAPFEKKLITRTPEGIDLQPIYSRTDGQKLALEEAWPGIPPYVRGAEALGSRAAGWWICQDPGTGSAAEYNAAVRHDLNRGQNALSLPLDAATRWGIDPAAAASSGGVAAGLPLRTIEDVKAALRGVNLAAVPVFASAGLAPLAVTRLLTQWLVHEGEPASSLHGAVLGDPFAEWVRGGNLPRSLDAVFDDLTTLTRWAQQDALRLRTMGVDASVWADAGAHAVQELAFALATGSAYLRAAHERGLSVEDTAPRVLFTFGLGSNLFMEISKLRAARLIWARAMEAAGGGATAQRLVCHGRTTRWNKTVLDPHVNLLRTTVEAFAGVVGGCAGLHVGAYDEIGRVPDERSRRLARNIQIILAEECQLGRVVDPAGGSWYVETLTRQLAAKAWALFQEIERRGGMAAAIRDGFPQGLVEATAAERIKAVETRRDGIIGTNLHPNLAEEIPPAESDRRPARDSTPAPVAEQTAVKRLVARRRAEPYEALRRRTDAGRARTGTRPTVFLAGMGPRQQHAARLDFSRAFFAAGGFEVKAGHGFTTAEAAVQAALESGAPMVVICSTDETYPTLVPSLATGMTAAGKPPLVVVAGQPATPELEQQYRSAGVAEFIHLRANNAKLLAGFLDRLGL